ncbi:sensor histidine kinase [Angustibacter aerolatus]
MTAPAEASTGAAPWPVERRPRLRAVAVSGACCVLGLLVFLVTAGMALDGSDAGPRRPAAWLLLLAADAVVGVTASALAGFLRGSRAASVALVVAAACSSWALPAGVVGVVRLGARRSTALDVLVVAVLVGGGLGSARVSRLVAPPERDPLPWWGEALALAVSAVVLLLWGRVRGSRDAVVESLRRQAGAAEGERAALARSREADVARTRAEERTAIARDMHDTLSHQLSLIAVHAGALASRDDLPPQRAREAARTVRDAAADANTVLREVLLALRSTDPAQRLGHHGDAQPLPTPEALDALAAAAGSQGQEVTVTWDGLSPDDLSRRSPATAASLVQITGELLVNARRHAPGAPVEVVLAHVGGDLVLRAVNPLRPAAATTSGTGLGLVGVVERARLLGGHAVHGVTGDGCFVVEVTVPWRV